jgi:hypothetical protein
MSEEANLQPSNSNTERTNPEPKNYDKTIAHWTRILGISTIGLWLATLMSAWFLYHTDETIKNQARIQLRAYVGLLNAGSLPVTRKQENKPDEILAANIGVVWKNFGTTPANEVENWISARWYPPGAEPDFTIPAQRLSDKFGINLGPGGEVGSGAIFVSIDDFQKATSGNGRIFFWGHISYKDVFVDTPVRNSHFCAVVVGKPPEAVGFNSYRGECNYSN